MKSNNIILKTGISVFLCIVISRLLHLKYPFFVALPSFVPISNSAAESLKAGRNRMLGTLIGAAVGVLFAFIKPGNSVLCGIGIGIIIYLCNYIRWGNSASIAGLVFISIMVGIKGENPFIYSIHRIINTLIGITITILVNNLIFRSDIVKKNYDSCNEIMSIALNFIKQKICDNKEMEFDNLDKKIEEVQKELNNYLQEFVPRKTTRNRIDKFKNIIDEFICISRHLKILNSIDYPFNLNQQNNEIFKTLFKVDCGCENYSHSDMNIIFNYHLEKLFQQLSSIDNMLYIHTD